MLALCSGTEVWWSPRKQSHLTCSGRCGELVRICLESRRRRCRRRGIDLAAFAIFAPDDLPWPSYVQELKNCGYVEHIVAFILRDIPLQPPPWSSALWSKGDSISGDERECLEKARRSYFLQTGLRTAFRMLSGLCNGHEPTHSLVASIGERKNAKGDASFLTACHWLEGTSDKANGMGLLAETLLDELGDGNDHFLKEV